MGRRYRLTEITTSAPDQFPQLEATFSIPKISDNRIDGERGFEILNTELQQIKREADKLGVVKLLLARNPALGGRVFQYDSTRDRAVK